MLLYEMTFYAVESAERSRSSSVYPFYNGWLMPGYRCGIDGKTDGKGRGAVGTLLMVLELYSRPRISSIIILYFYLRSFL